jgi:leucyl-tRNA synthetase
MRQAKTSDRLDHYLTAAKSHMNTVSSNSGSSPQSRPDTRSSTVAPSSDSPTDLDRYEPGTIEAEAQNFWESNKTFEVIEDPSREKFYCLSMFPYPSGRLHMGHVRNYTIGDVISRYQRMLGKNVMQPMGWDAFGLPAENAAIDNNVPPAQWTYENIDYMKAQLKRLGFGYDWSRELATCRPEYYRWEQWLFNRMYEKGIAYKRNAEVNWDPIEGTVLANEQVINGRGWRSGALVERREIPHWFLRITDYAEELLDDLDNVGWPDAVKTMQRNWLGRSQGVEFSFELEGGGEPIPVFTTRPDTLFGVTYMAVATGHTLASEAARDNPEIRDFIEQCRKMETSEAALETMDKLGMPTGLHAIHPLTGESIPIWIANFVLMSYGTGAIMAVPGHDVRDHEFARKYDLPIVQVIKPANADVEIDIAEEAFVDYGVLMNSGEFDGLSSADAFDAIATWFEDHGKGKRTINYRLRDWGVSRQRYWGCPVPVMNSEARGELPVPDDELPVVLPEDVSVSGGGSPLAKLPDFVHTTDRQTGAKATRETDTFDTFMESAWYYARFASPDAHDRMLDERANYWLPVDLYIGGIEHAILHLLYARFYHKVMRDLGLVECDEPFANLLTQGMVLKETFFREQADGQKIYYRPNEVDVDHDDKGRIIGARLLSDGDPVEVGGVEKMSKSKNNGVDPEDMVQRYGADTIRLYMMFQAPPDQTLEWQDTAVEGAFRFLRQLWRNVIEHCGQGHVGSALPGYDPSALDGPQKNMRRVIHETIAKVSDDIGRRYKFNTAIAAVMELLNALRAWQDQTDAGRTIRQEGYEAAVLLLSPIVPHITHVLWQRLGHGDDIVDTPWPSVEESALVRDELTLVVQVNGKLRAKIDVSASASKEEIEALAAADANVQRFLEGKEIRKMIVVPGKLVNIVV